MKLIDIHTHIYPPAIARKAAASIREFYQLGTEEMDGTAETLLQRGDEAGIDRFVILPEPGLGGGGAGCRGAGVREP